MGNVRNENRSKPIAGKRNYPRPSYQNMPKEAGTERAMRSVPARALSHILMVMVIVVVFMVVAVVVVVVHFGESGDRRHRHSRTKNDSCNNFLQHVVISP